MITLCTVAANTATDSSTDALTKLLSWAAAHQAGFTAGIIALIALLFTYWLAVYLRRLRRIRRSIASVLERWGDLDAREFFGRLDEIHEHLSSDPHLGHAWTEFKETFLFPDPADPGAEQVVSNTIDAGEFFNEDTILSPSIDLTFVRTIPNVLTGIGIFGTFLGLVLGLYGSHDLVEHPKHIGALLSGAYLAFLTSLAGLFTSILFSMLVTPRLHALSAALGDLVAYLDSRVKRLTVEQLSRELLAHARRQTRSLETFATDVAVAIGDRLSADFTGKLLPVLTELTTAVRNTLVTERDTIVEELSKVVHELRKQIGKATRQQLDGLARTLEKIQSKLDRVSMDLTKRVEEAGFSFRTKMNESAQALHEGVEQLLTRLENAGDSFAKGMADATQGLLSATVALEEKRQLLLEVLSGLEGPLGALQETIPRLRQAAEQLETAAKTIGDASPTLDSLGKHLLEAIGATKNVAAQLQTLLARADKGIDHLHRAWEDQAKRLSALAERFEGLDDGLADVFTRIQEGVSDYGKQVSRFHKELDDNVAKISGTLAATIKELAEVCDQLGGNERR